MGGIGAGEAVGDGIAVFVAGGGGVDGTGAAGVFRDFDSLRVLGKLRGFVDIADFDAEVDAGAVGAVGGVDGDGVGVVLTLVLRVFKVGGFFEAEGGGFWV